MKQPSKSQPWLMTALRSILFLLFQALVAVILFLTGSQTDWHSSEAWWPFAVILTDIVGMFLLIHFYDQEGKRFWDVFQIKQQFVKQDLKFMAGFLLITALVGYLPNLLSARWLFSDHQIALDMLVRPLPVWATMISVVFFPLLQGVVEIPTYMVYALPRLETQGIRPRFAIALVSFFLSAQHIFAPFIPNIRFIAYRFIMFLPFAIVIAVVMRWRPRLMPYIAVLHVFMDLSIAAMFLMNMQS